MYEQTPNQTHTHTYIDYIHTYTHTYNRGSKQLKATYPYKLQTSKHSYSFIKPFSVKQNIQKQN